MARTNPIGQNQTENQSLFWYINTSVVKALSNAPANTPLLEQRLTNSPRMKTASRGPPNAAVSFLPISNTSPSDPTRQARPTVIDPMSTTSQRIVRTSSLSLFPSSP